MSDLKVRLSIQAVTQALSPIKRTQNALAKLQNQSAQISSYTKAQKALFASAAAMRANQQALTQAKAAYSSASAPTTALKNNVAAAGRAYHNSKIKMLEQKRALESLRAALKAAGINTSQLRIEQQRIASQIDRTNSRLGRMQQFKNVGGKVFGSIGKGLGGLVRGLGWVGLAISGVRQVVGAVAGLVRPFIEVGAQFEKYQVMLNGIEGSTEKGAKSMRWLSSFAKRMGTDLGDTTAAFIQMRNFGLDPTNGSLESLVDMNARMGGSAENLQGMVLALGQAWGAGKLQGQDIMQLINRGVPVWDLLSKMTGKSTAELKDLSAQGWLGRDAIAGLIDEMGALSKGSQKAQLNTFNGQLTALSSHWMNFKKMVSDSGPFKLLKEQLGELLSKLTEMTNNGELQKWASRVGMGIVLVFKTASIVAKVFGAILKGLLFPFRAVYEIGKKIGDIFSWIIEKIDALTDAGLGNLIGRGVALVAAGLGNADAQAALDAEASASGTLTSQPTTLVAAAGAQKQQDARVSGELKITIDSEGRPKVAQMDKTGDFDLNAIVGRNLVGVM